ncbi:ROK family protein [Ruania alba]|uniref:Sugar kinase of the NBD/HSP70 family, may contain an N-terminal HTH domain n=1 Tax=Ruania alba TaxID=648782 RepID=A0A1H5BDJ6_9MICO|nr:ROK family transcriptional regulator [Ruania alba]SED52475.1 Sugar kinase of the NBD/HSP70 family, may contain an N-terminal HTH domain [Ruania alba]
METSPTREVASERTALLRSTASAPRVVFTTILTRSPISRIDVARHTGLSQAAVTKAVSPLMVAGLVADYPQARQQGRAGRPASPVTVVPEALVVIGVKVNTDEVIAVATDLRTEVLHRARLSLTSPAPEAVVEAIAAVCDSLKGALGSATEVLAGVGVAVSGDVDTDTGVVRESALMRWTGVDLGARLHRRLDLPVVIENDVRALTFAEHWFGVGVGTQSFAIVTIGRGIGSGLHVNAEVIEGAYGVAGEIGHLPLGPPQRLCSCGRRGCVEAVAGTAAIVAAVSAAHGRAITIEEAVTLAHDGDPAANAAFGEAATVIGTAIASLVNLIGPELVIIGGEAVRNFDLFDAQLRAAFAAHAFGAAAECRIVVRPHSFEDWARGAAAGVIRSLVA